MWGWVRGGPQDVGAVWLDGERIGGVWRGEGDADQQAGGAVEEGRGGWVLKEERFCRAGEDVNGRWRAAREAWDVALFARGGGVGRGCGDLVVAEEADRREDAWGGGGALPSTAKARQTLADAGEPFGDVWQSEAVPQLVAERDRGLGVFSVNYFCRSCCLI